MTLPAAAASARCPAANAASRRRRDALLEALAVALPEVTVRGIAAGLHATVQLPDTDDEWAILEQARRRRIALGVLGDYRMGPVAGRPTLLLGYARTAESALRTGVRELAEAVRAARAGEQSS